jgi:molybdopterin adenylyltransferase
MTPPEAVRIGIVSVSDRASSGVYEDKGLPASRTGWGVP